MSSNISIEDSNPYCIVHCAKNVYDLRSSQISEYALNLPSEPDTQTQQLLKKLNAQIDQTTNAEIQKVIFPQIRKIEDIEIWCGPNGPITCRLYSPHVQGSLPVFVFFHGGGWVSGNLDEYDYFCQQICHQTPSLVISVAYHLAPEYKFPKPLEDCYAATQWIVDHIHRYGGDPQRLAVGGDSAGGNLAAAVTLMARDKQTFKINYQVLIFPVLNYQFSSVSYKKYAEGFYLTKQLMQNFWKSYLNTEEEGQLPYASPLKADTLSNLPQAFIVLANFDVLFSEGIEYTSRLLQAGIATELKCYPTIHAFINFEKDLEIADEAMRQIAKRLQNL